MDRCALCPAVHTCLPPDGPEDATQLLVGEAPGYDEERKKRVFIGKTGEEVNRHYLPLAGLRREHVLVTNAIRCLSTSNKGKLDPKSPKDLALLNCCAQHHLYPLIARMQPTVIVTLGGFAAKALDPTISLDLHHGFPYDTTYGPVFVMYHPASGMHEPKKMLHIRTDWMRLKAYLKGVLYVPTDEYPNPDYREVMDAREIQDLDPSDTLACDTEFDRHRHPYCLTYSTQVGSGRLILDGRRDLLSHFQRQLDHWTGDILFHHWPADAPITEALGLQFPPRRIKDTMAAVFHLGNLPQGLKALALRELGMEMQDFDDLTRPYSTQQVLQYLRRAYLEDWPKPPEQLIRMDDNSLKPYKPQGMNTKLKRFFGDYEKNPDKDVFGAWENWEAHHAEIETVCGEWPGLDIRHVPFDQVVQYACRDADATLRLWPVLRKMQRMVRKLSQERWRES